MPVDVIMPKVDMDMAQGTISQWHAADGDRVTKGEPLFDIETDKANMEIDAPASGLLRNISAAVGDTVDIGSCIASIFSVDEADEAATLKPADPVPSESATEAVNPVVPVPQAGPDLVLDTVDLPVSDGAQNVLAEVDSKSGSPAAGTLRASPHARRLAKQHGLALASIVGSGPRGRITGQDVERRVLLGQAPDSVQAAINVDAPAATVAASSAAPFAGKNAIVNSGQLEALGVAHTIQPRTRMRETIARRLTESKNSVPHFYVERDCRMDKLEAFRTDFNAIQQGSAGQQDGSGQQDGTGSKVSVNDIVVFAASRALQMVPEANVCWAEEGIATFSSSNISIAVSIEGGLVTPVLRGAEQLSIQSLSAEVVQLAEKARSGRLSADDCRGGSMSVSNLGMFGVQRFQAIINPPESMILAVGEMRTAIVADEEGRAVSGRLMSVSLSCDHRVIDGVVAARWMQAFQRLIENPLRLLM